VDRVAMPRPPKEQTLTLTEFRREPGERIREVYREGRIFVLTKSGKPVARIVPIAKSSGDR
jgi:prevent-host-death family protein